MSHISRRHPHGQAKGRKPPRKKEYHPYAFFPDAEKSLSEITITELVEGAGVARASFYRNYCSKEDVLVTLIRDVLDDFRSKIPPGQESFYTYENVLLSFRYFHTYRDYILDLYRSGFASVFLEELNRFHESVEGSMPSSSIEKYQLYMYIGALFNTTLEWLLERDTATPRKWPSSSSPPWPACCAPSKSPAHI